MSTIYGSIGLFHSKLRRNFDAHLFSFLASAAQSNVKYINCVRDTVMYLADLEKTKLAFQGKSYFASLHMKLIATRQYFS